MADITRQSSRRRNPALRSFRREMDRLFEDFLSSPGSGRESGMWTPRLDLSETDDEYVISADLPGLSKEDVHVDLQDGQLSISGERREEREEQKKNYHRRERSYGSFHRSMALPSNVNVEDIKAEFDNGVLTVHLPKEEKEQPKQIEIS